jgi:hypothetical protein
MVASGVAFRVASMVSIFAAGLVGAALPFFVSSRYPRVLGLLNAAAAGVFLAAALVHLLVRPQLHRRGGRDCNRCDVCAWALYRTTPKRTPGCSAGQRWMIGGTRFPGCVPRRPPARFPVPN